MSEDAPKPPQAPSTTRQLLEAVGRAAASAVPLAGGALVEVFTYATTYGRQRRLDVWMEEVVDVLQRHGVQIAELGDSDGYLDAIGPATRAAIETASEEKRQALTAAVLNATLETDLDADERAILLGLIVRLTPTHLRLLRILDDPDTALDAVGQRRRDFYVASRSQMVGQVAPDLVARSDLLAQVADALEREMLARPNLSTMMSSGGIYERSSTDLGRRLLHFVTEPSES